MDTYKVRLELVSLLEQNSEDVDLILRILIQYHHHRVSVEMIALTQPRCHSPLASSVFVKGKIRVKVKEIKIFAIK